MSQTRLAAVIFSSSFLLLGSAFGQKAVIEADVRGVDGAAAKGAEVRIERQDKKAPPVIAKTDKQGRAVANDLEVGSYKVTATVEGGVQSSQMVKTRSSKPTLVPLDMRKTVAVASKGKKRSVWVPSQTGTRLGGHWEEVGADVPAKTGPYGGPVDTMNGDAFSRQHGQMPTGP